MEAHYHSRRDIGGVPCRLGAKLQPLYARNQLFSYATRYHLCHLLPLLPDMVSVRILRLYFATESKNERFMETRKHCIGTMRIARRNPCRFSPAGIRISVAAKKRCRTDLLICCRTVVPLRIYAGVPVCIFRASPVWAGNAPYHRGNRQALKQLSIGIFNH